MKKVKSPNVSGAFYPSNKDELLTMIEVFLNEKEKALDLAIPPKAIISPHAGYLFSGPIAASAYRELIPFKSKIKKVAILSPSHFCSFTGIALCSFDSFRTPLGELFVDHSYDHNFIKIYSAKIEDVAYENEHSLEVQLPFLQVALGNIEIIPLIVGKIDDFSLVSIIDDFIKNDVFIVVSSDLSHFNNYKDCCEKDSITKVAIERNDLKDIHKEDACGVYPLRGLVSWCSSHHYTIKNLDLRNSGDTSDIKDRVVGYGAWIVPS